MKLILVASMQLAAYLVSSALRTSMTMIFSRLRLNGSYSSRMTASACGLSVPMMIRSGRMQSSTAQPSLRNSGLETTSNVRSLRSLSTSTCSMHARTRSPVPTGTVDLSTTIW
ncbi:hypothetical protein D3C84_988250 [compost metagenome]